MKTLVAIIDKSAYRGPMTTTPTTAADFAAMAWADRIRLYHPIPFDGWDAVCSPDGRVCARFCAPEHAVAEAVRLNAHFGLAV